MKKDWIFSDENSICHFRVAGVLIKDNKLFVQSEKDGEDYALPGGHVNIGETSEASLIREYKEETGADIVCERLIWVEESFWKWGGKNAHGIVFYYLISLKNDADIPEGYFASQKDNCNVVLEWVGFEQLKHMMIYPEFLKDRIYHIADEVEHFVSHE